MKKQIQDSIRMVLWCVILGLVARFSSSDVAIIVGLSWVLSKVESWDIWKNKDR